MMAFFVSCEKTGREDLDKIQQDRDQGLGPNIVLVLADDLGYGDIGFYGATKIATPHMDELAQNGLAFLDAHTAGAVCQPSRYSLLTGTYFWRSDQAKAAFEKRDLMGHMPEMVENGRQTLASLLQEAGYQTAYLGKWHLGMTWQTNDGKEPADDGANVSYGQPFSGGPLDHGFDYYYGIAASLDMPPYTFLEDDRVAEVPNVYWDQFKTFRQPGFKSPSWKDTVFNTAITSKATGLIDEYSKRPSPYFLFIALGAPHTPHRPSERTKGKSGAGARGDMVMEVDWTVGEIIDALKRSGQYENTLLILTSDNGAITTGPAKWAIQPAWYEVKDYGHSPNGYFKGQKGDIYEGGHRVPFIVHWPGKIKKPRTIDHIISLTDVFATLATLVRQPVKDALDSYDLSSYLFHETVEQPVRKRITHYAYHHDLYAYRTDTLKYINGLGYGGFMGPFMEQPTVKEGVQLYNMAHDPTEQTNIAASHPAVVSKLDSALKHDLSSYPSELGRSY